MESSNDSAEETVNGPSDNEQVLRVLRGDDASYGKIVERHQGRIFFLGLKFFRNYEDAEDFSQDVFLRAFKRLDTFRGNVPFSAWLYKLAYNLAVNKYHVRKPDIREDADAEAIIASQTQPDEGVIQKETKTVVQECLKRLPSLYNIVVKMHYFDGLSYQEISEITEIPVNTLKSHIRRAKKLLTDLLDKMRERKNGT